MGALGRSVMASTTHIGNGAEADHAAGKAATAAAAAGSLKGRPKKPSSSSAAAAALRPPSEVDDLLTLLHGSDPVRVELSRLDNELRGEVPLFLLLSLSLSEILDF